MSVLPWRRTSLKPLDDPPTVTAEIETPPRLVSIDELIGDIRHCRSRVVDLQCELAKAEIAEERAKDRFVEALRVLDNELGTFTRKLQ